MFEVLRNAWTMDIRIPIMCHILEKIEMTEHCEMTL